MEELANNLASEGKKEAAEEEKTNHASAAEKQKEKRFGKSEEGIEWRTNWEPTVDLPSGLDVATATQETLEDTLLAVNEAKLLKQKAARDYSSIPEQEITPEVKRDFRVLRLRGTMDPKRFYKGSDESKIPKRFQWGTVIEGPTEFYSSRIARRDRKQTFTQEILGDSEIAAYRKRKFKSLQDEAQKSATKQGKQVKRKQRKKSLHRGYKG